MNQQLSNQLLSRGGGGKQKNYFQTQQEEVVLRKVHRDSRVGSISQSYYQTVVQQRTLMLPVQRFYNGTTEGISKAPWL